MRILTQQTRTHPSQGFEAEPVDADAKRLSSGTRTGLKDDAREEDENSRPGTSLAVVFGVVAALALILAGALLLRGFKASSAGSLNLSTEPSGVAVLVDGQPRGETPLRLDSLEAGQHTLTLTKEGYAPASQAFTVSSEQPSSLAVQLQPLAPVPAAKEPLQLEAVALFNKGLLLDASQRCDSLLAKDPYNEVATGLKTKIRDHYWQQSQLAQRRDKISEARLALQNLLRVSPQDATALRALKGLPEQSEGETPERARASIFARQDRRTAQPDRLRNECWKLLPACFRQCLCADSAARCDVAIRPGSLETGWTRFTARRSPNCNGRSRAKIRRVRKRWAGSFRRYFPASAELRSLRESIKTEDAGQLEARNSLMQKLDSAMAHGNYVTPANDNALAYCNRLLALDSQNAKAQGLKRDICDPSVCTGEGPCEQRKV